MNPIMRINVSNEFREKIETIRKIILSCTKDSENIEQREEEEDTTQPYGILAYTDWK